MGRLKGLESDVDLPQFPYSWRSPSTATSAGPPKRCTSPSRCCPARSRRSNPSLTPGSWCAAAPGPRSRRPVTSWPGTPSHCWPTPKPYAGRHASRAGPRTVTIAFMPGLIVTEPARELGRAHPELAVEVLRTGWDTQTAVLHEGRADVSYVRLPVDRHRLQLEPLFSEPRVAVLPIDHPLAGKDRSACATWPMTICSSTRTPFRSGAISPPNCAGGAAPHHPGSATPSRKSSKTSRPGEASSSCLRPPPSTTAGPHRLRFQLTDLPPAQTALAWSSTRRSPLITEFVEIATTRLACGGGR